MRTAKIFMSAMMALAASTSAYAADISDGKVKIGILNDQSGVYASFGGKYSYEAAKMAAEDFGGTVLGGPVCWCSVVVWLGSSTPPGLAGCSASNTASKF